MSNAELAASYAALILADDGLDITVRSCAGKFQSLLSLPPLTHILSQADKLNTLIKAAGITDVEPIWATLFAKALEGKNVKDMLLNVGSGGGAPAAAPAAGGAPAGGAAAEAAPAEEEKEEGKPTFPRLRTNLCCLVRGC